MAGDRDLIAQTNAIKELTKAIKDSTRISIALNYNVVELAKIIREKEANNAEVHEEELRPGG